MRQGSDEVSQKSWCNPLVATYTQSVVLNPLDSISFNRQWGVEDGLAKKVTAKQ